MECIWQLKKAAIIIVSNARVLNMPVNGEPVWTLGGYLHDSGALPIKTKWFLEFTFQTQNLKRFVRAHI